MLRRGQPDVHPAAREAAVPGRPQSDPRPTREDAHLFREKVRGRTTDNDGRIVDAEDAEGRTLLWHAALHDDVQSAKVLLERGCAHLDFGTGLRPPLVAAAARAEAFETGPRGHVLVLRHGDGPRPALAPRTDRGVSAAVAARLLRHRDSFPSTWTLDPLQCSSANKHTHSIYADLVLADAVHAFRSLSTVWPEPESPTT